MNWGSLISTVVSTAGTVLGSLLKAPQMENGVVRYVFSNVEGSNSDFRSDFAYDGEGRLRLYNLATNDNDRLMLTFPIEGTGGFQSVTLGGFQSFDVTDLFSDNAEKDNSNFELSGFRSTPLPADGLSSSRSLIKLSAQARGIPVDGKQHSIGTFYDVIVNTDSVQVELKSGGELDSIQMISITSGRDSAMRLLDIKGKDNVAIVPLSQPLVKGDLVTIEIMGSAVETRSRIDELKADSRFAEIDEDTRKRLNNAPALNWKN